VPRLYHIHRKNVAGLNTVADFFANIFEPLFAATLDPQAHPEIHLFLQQVISLLGKFFLN
jgi:AMP deaminase